MRTINLHLSRIPDNREQAAINYLSLWCIPSYPVVDIYHDGDRDFLAVYREPGDDTQRYVIGAVWHDDTKSFSFHS